MSPATQLKITSVVSQYERDFAPEFAMFKKAISSKRDNLSNRFAETKGLDYVERLLFEVPETLDTLLINRLEPDEMVEYRSLTGSQWFAKHFPEFRVAESL